MPGGKVSRGAFRGGENSRHGAARAPHLAARACPRGNGGRRAALLANRRSLPRPHRAFLVLGSTTPLVPHRPSQPSRLVGSRNRLEGRPPWPPELFDLHLVSNICHTFGAGTNRKACQHSVLRPPGFCSSHLRLGQCPPRLGRKICCADMVAIGNGTSSGPDDTGDRSRASSFSANAGLMAAVCFRRCFAMYVCMYVCMYVHVYHTKVSGV